MWCFLTKFQSFVREGNQNYWESSGEWILCSRVTEQEVYSFLPSAIPVHFVHDSFTCIPLSWVHHQSDAMPAWWNNCFLKANHKASRMCNTTGHVARLNYWWVQYINLTVWNSQTVSIAARTQKCKLVHHLNCCIPKKNVWWSNIYHWWQCTARTDWAR